MDTKTFQEVHDTIPQKIDPEAYWKARAEKAEAKLELYQFVASYAQDVIDFWPSMTMRTIRLMIPKMDSLKQALGLLK